MFNLRLSSVKSLVRNFVCLPNKVPTARSFFPLAIYSKMYLACLESMWTYRICVPWIGTEKDSWVMSPHSNSKASKNRVPFINNLKLLKCVRSAVSRLRKARAQLATLPAFCPHADYASPAFRLHSHHITNNHTIWPNATKRSYLRQHRRLPIV